ncbi:hypothetical protein CCR75_002629 [Bremia lactucae]|uniref:Uncharacterized protein n=1 Tax=Bremia lactucae TaxID=4779 RepID=A0A976P067_BRELC|nr:hypothetical protein CCR75_002629 [Bremia lactucae]
MHEGVEHLKRTGPLSTVSLDSSYDEDGNRAKMHQRHDYTCWIPFVLLAGFILVAVFLVLALDHDANLHQGANNEDDPISMTKLSSLTSNKHLTAPQRKLSEWFNLASNASQLVVEGSNSNASFTGVLYPRVESNSLLPFDALLAIQMGEVLPNWQYIALQNDRGYKWVVTPMGDGNSIITNGCLNSNQISPFDGLDSVFFTASWASPFDKYSVTIVFNKIKYTISQVNDDSDDLMAEDTCWLIESEDEDIGLSVCIRDLLLKSDLGELFRAARGCSRLALSSVRSLRQLMGFVPLPLWKWYASFNGLS